MWWTFPPIMFGCAVWILGDVIIVSQTHPSLREIRVPLTAAEILKMLELVSLRNQ